MRVAVFQRKGVPILKLSATLKPLAFATVSINQLNRLEKRAYCKKLQPTQPPAWPQPRQTLTSMRGALHDDAHAESTEQPPTSNGSVWIDRGIRPLQQVLQARLYASIPHILNGVMTGNIPECVLHGVNCYLLSTLLDKLEHCFGKPEHELIAHNTTKSDLGVNDTTVDESFSIPSAEVDSLIHNLKLMLHENTVTRSLNESDLFKLRTSATIRLIKAEVTYPGILKGDFPHIEPKQRSQIEALFSALEQRYLFSYSDKPAPKDLMMLGLQQDHRAVSMRCLQLLLEPSDLQPLLGEVIDPTLKLESALRLLNLQVRCPDLLSRGEDDSDALHHLYRQLSEKEPIDISFDL